MEITRVQRRNAPTGWAAFRAFRQEPARQFVRRHGNWKHGDYSKSRIAGMREVRLLARIVRSGRWEGPLPWTRPAPPGWAAYPYPSGECRG